MANIDMSMHSCVLSSWFFAFLIIYFVENPIETIAGSVSLFIIWHLTNKLKNKIQTKKYLLMLHTNTHAHTAQNRQHSTADNRTQHEAIRCWWCNPSRHSNGNKMNCQPQEFVNRKERESVREREKGEAKNINIQPKHIVLHTRQYTFSSGHTIPYTPYTGIKCKYRRHPGHADKTVYGFIGEQHVSLSSSSSLSFLLLVMLLLLLFFGRIHLQ